MFAPGRSAVRSDSCAVGDLYLPFEPGAEAGTGLDLSSGWVKRWSAVWQVDDDEIIFPVRDLASAPLAMCEPVRNFRWHAKQRHRPGLQFMVSTGRHHAFESLEEQRLLLALDFCGAALVASQPFRLSFVVSGERREHIPDFLAVLPDGSTWVFDVRPRARVDARAETSFAATAEVALSAGWHYAVVTGWRPHVLSVLDELSSRRRPLVNVLGLQDQLLLTAIAGARTFAALVAATSLPAVARARALHLLWHHRLGLDLSQPLTDRSIVWRAGGRSS
jgi:hypothetical protein